LTGIKICSSQNLQASRTLLGMTPGGASGRAKQAAIDYSRKQSIESYPGPEMSQTRAQSRNFLRLSHLRRLRDCEQVAAVCYRVRGRDEKRRGKAGNASHGRDSNRDTKKEDIQFLLVQTRGGRWTFPKGSAEPGLTHAQAAALEAFEEAGVHGRMEEARFTRYTYRKRGASSAAAEFAVSAHLCEVLRLEAPEESNRTPTWFSACEAKRCLREDHTTGCGAELARVVDRAVRRIRQLQERRVQILNPPGGKVIEIDSLLSKVSFSRSSLEKI